MKIFTIYDSKATAYLQPFFSKTEQTAVRDVTTIVNEPNSNFNLHAEDFSLFTIGKYDEDSGKITAKNPEHIVNLIALRNDNTIPNLQAIEGGKTDEE